MVTVESLPRAFADAEAMEVLLYCALNDVAHIITIRKLTNFVIAVFDLTNKSDSRFLMNILLLFMKFMCLSTFQK